MAIELATIKEHLRVHPDDTSEDGLIQGYVEAAKEHVAQHCDRRLVDGTPSGPDEMGLTADVRQAILMLVAHWYATREAVVTGTINSQVQLGVERLLWYRKQF